MSVLADSRLTNPLATIQQLETSRSRLDGVSSELENSARFAGASLTQAAGILLRLSQDVTVQAIVIFTRFWAGSDGGSLLQYDALDISAACIYLAAKTSAYPKSPRSVLNVYSYLASLSTYPTTADGAPTDSELEAAFLSDGNYQTQRMRLFKHEATILRALGFQTFVAVPHTLCINYLQALEILNRQAPEQDMGHRVVRTALAHLNSALLSPQLLYLTHQPSSLATSAIYLAAREEGVKLPDGEWWAVVDCDREELGFLVVAYLSVKRFAEAERQKWGDTRPPLTTSDIRRLMGREQ